MPHWRSCRARPSHMASATKRAAPLSAPQGTLGGGPASAGVGAGAFGGGVLHFHAPPQVGSP